MKKTAMRTADTTRDLQLAAELLELWRLCGKSCCRRARCCRGDARACCEIVAEWSEVFRLKDKRANFEQAIERLREQQT